MLWWCCFVVQCLFFMCLCRGLATRFGHALLVAGLCDCGHPLSLNHYYPLEIMTQMVLVGGGAM